MVGMVFLGIPFYQQWGPGERCKVRQWDPGRTPADKRFAICIAIDVTVCLRACLSVRPRISKTYPPNFMYLHRESKKQDT